MSATAPLWADVFEVEVDPGHVAAFSRALGGQDDTIPPTYPMAWLGQPAIKAALAGAVVQRAGPQSALVHLTQRIEQARPLALGATYSLTVRLDAGAAPRSLLLEANYVDATGQVGRLVAEFLVLVPESPP